MELRLACAGASALAAELSCWLYSAPLSQTLSTPLPPVTVVYIDALAASQTLTKRINPGAWLTSNAVVSDPFLLTKLQSYFGHSHCKRLRAKCLLVASNYKCKIPQFSLVMYFRTQLTLGKQSGLIRSVFILQCKDINSHWLLLPSVIRVITSPPAALSPTAFLTHMYHTYHIHYLMHAQK